MQSKKLVILAQAFISGMMACLMTGFFALIEFGPTWHWLLEWGHRFVIAWPVAFLFSLLVGPLAFRIASTLLGGHRAP